MWNVREGQSTLLTINGLRMERLTFQKDGLDPRDSRSCVPDRRLVTHGYMADQLKSSRLEGQTLSGQKNVTFSKKQERGARIV